MPLREMPLREMPLREMPLHEMPLMSLREPLVILHAGWFLR